MIVDIYNPKCNPEGIFREFRRACGDFPIKDFTINELIIWIRETQNGYSEDVSDEARRMVTVWIELGYVSGHPDSFIWDFIL